MYSTIYPVGLFGLNCLNCCWVWAVLGNLQGLIGEVVDVLDIVVNCFETGRAAYDVERKLGFRWLYCGVVQVCKTGKSSMSFLCVDFSCLVVFLRLFLLEMIELLFEVPWCHLFFVTGTYWVIVFGNSRKHDVF